jgi:hypothetical protein
VVSFRHQNGDAIDEAQQVSKETFCCPETKDYRVRRAVTRLWHEITRFWHAITRLSVLVPPKNAMFFPGRVPGLWGWKRHPCANQTNQ